MSLTGAIQRISANDKSSLEQKNWRFFISEQSLMRELRQIVLLNLICETV